MRGSLQFNIDDEPTMLSGKEGLNSFSNNGRQPVAA